MRSNSGAGHRGLTKCGEEVRAEQRTAKAVLEDGCSVKYAGLQFGNHGLELEPGLAKEVGEESVNTGLANGPDLV